MFDNDTVLIGGAEIARRVEELGAEISAWVASRGVSLVVVWLAEGAVYFAADLTRKLTTFSTRGTHTRPFPECFCARARRR